MDLDYTCESYHHIDSTEDAVPEHIRNMFTIDPSVIEIVQLDGESCRTWIRSYNER